VDQRPSSDMTTGGWKQCAARALPFSSQVNPAGVERLVADASSPPSFQVRRSALLDISACGWAAQHWGRLAPTLAENSLKLDRRARTCPKPLPAQASAEARFLTAWKTCMNDIHAPRRTGHSDCSGFKEPAGEASCWKATEPSVPKADPGSSWGCPEWRFLRSQPRRAAVAAVEGP